MGTILYDFLNDSFLFDKDQLSSRFSGRNDKTLQSELARYRHFCLRSLSELRNEIPPDRPNSFLFSGRNSLSLENLKATALYVEGHILDDPLFEFANEPNKNSKTFSKYLGYKGGGINRERLCEIITFLRELTPMVATNYVKFLPLSRIYEPPKEIGLYYSDNYYSDVLPELIMDVFHKKAVIRSMVRSENGWKVLEELTPSRGIFINFEGHPGKTGYVYHLQEMRPVHYDEKRRTARVEFSLPDTPPEASYFKAWTFQSVNQAARDLYTGTMSEFAISAQHHAMFTTNSRLVFELLGLLGTQTSGISGHTVRSLLNIDLPFLENIDVATLMKIRASDGEAFQGFRDALEQGFRGLRGETDENRLKQKTEDLLHELTEVQVRNVDRKLRSLQRSALIEAVVAILGLAGAVHTAGWSLLAASTAIFQGYKTFEAYQREAKSNPAYFLWKVKQ